MSNGQYDYDHVNHNVLVYHLIQFHIDIIIDILYW